MKNLILLVALIFLLKCTQETNVQHLESTIQDVETETRSGILPFFFTTTLSWRNGGKQKVYNHGYVDSIVLVKLSDDLANNNGIIYKPYYMEVHGDTLFDRLKIYAPEYLKDKAVLYPDMTNSLIDTSSNIKYVYIEPTKNKEIYYDLGCLKYKTRFMYNIQTNIQNVSEYVNPSNCAINAFLYKHK